MNENAQEILEKIKEKNIQPRKRWEFLLKNYLLWFIFILTIILGSLASAVSIFIIKYSLSTGYWSHLNSWQRLWFNLPIFWLIILLFFWLLAWYDFKSTKNGYKYHPTWILFLSIILSIVFGLVVYQLGIGQRLEESFFRRVPFYQKIFKHGGRMMTAPDRGRLPGVVKSIMPGKLVVEDFNGRIFEFSTTTDQFRVGQRVVLFGQIGPDSNFYYYMISPWFGPHNRPGTPMW